MSYRVVSYRILSHTCAFIRALTWQHKNDMSRDIFFFVRRYRFCPAQNKNGIQLKEQQRDNNKNMQ